MHRHDHELIAAVAEEILAADLAEAAEAEISACAECSAELADQRAALEALQTAAPAVLTDEETVRLRAAVAEAVNLPPAPVAELPRRRPSWRAIAVAAASLAGIVAFVPVVGMLTSGDDASVALSTTAAESLEAPTAGADATTRDGAADSQASAPEEADLTFGASDEEQVADTALPTTEAGAATTLAPAVAETLPAPRTLAGEAEIKDVFDAGPPNAAAVVEEPGEPIEPTCLAEAEIELGEAPLRIDLPATMDDGSTVIIYVDADWSTLIAFDAADCSPLLTLP
jgi:hypothetical protein